MGKRLQSDKEDLLQRLSKLTRKVSRIYKSKSKKGKKIQSATEDECEDKASDVVSAGYEFTSDNNIN